MSAPAYSIIQFLLSQVRTDTEALIGGKVYFYSPGTTSTSGITVYLDKDGSQLANNPYTLDGDATAQLYASGSYRIVIKDVNGVTQFDRDNLYFSSGPDYVTQLAIGNYATLAAAVTAIGSSSARLLINEAITVAADLSVPANIILERVEPGSITVNPGVTLTIVAAPLSDASQWFLGSGTVSVTGYPQDRAWWGESERIDAGGFNIKAASVLASPYAVQNLSFTATVGSKALTVALKGIDGNAPSATNPINIAFRSATATSSVLVLRTVTSATSVVLSSGSTLGFGAGATGNIYVWAIDYSGTVELALSNDISWSQNVLVSTTAEGGAGAADSATTLYSTSARTNVACRLLGFLTIQTGATAGEWDNAPTVLTVIGDATQARTTWSVPYANSTGALTDTALGAQYTVLMSNSASSAPTFQAIAEGTIAAAAVDQATLKTSSHEYEIETDTNAKYIASEYGFWPQIKNTNTNSVTPKTLTMAGTYSSNSATNYASYIMAVTTGTAAGHIFLKQIYITSSGEINWLFYLRDKVTKSVKMSWLCSDHPCMVSGSKDPNLVPHPFPDYNSDTDEIICINPSNEELDVIKAKIPKGGSLLQTINETYKIDDKVDKQWPTQAVTVGLPEDYDWRMAKSGADVTPIKSVIPKPSDVLCKALVSKEAVIKEVKE